MLSDLDIAEQIEQGRIRLDPSPAIDRFQPVSIDVTLAPELRVFEKYREVWPLRAIPDDLTEPDDCSDGYRLRPGEFVLGSTREVLTLPGDIAARLEGKSTNGRLGLLVHCTAGLIDPGFSGHITLEIANVSELVIVLEPDMPIGQLTFEECSTPVARPYGSPGLGSHYQHQRGPTPPTLRRREVSSPCPEPGRHLRPVP
jgi:dCTP deaminase